MSTETKTTMQTKTGIGAQGQAKEKFGIRALVNIGMLSAIAIILMLFEIPLPFAPSFYEIDFSEVPVMFCDGTLCRGAHRVCEDSAQFRLYGDGYGRRG